MTSLNYFGFTMQIISFMLAICTATSDQSKLDKTYYSSTKFVRESNLSSSKEHNKPIHDIKETTKPDVVVAKDGSGKYQTIGEAIIGVPLRSSRRYVIYVKKGVYDENVRIEKEKWNVFIYGDGMDNTIVSGNRSHNKGFTTRMSATFAVFGEGFIAKDIGFRNTAGPDSRQAVALFSSSDKSVFYRCLIDGHQNTLYAHFYRQFYRECKIYGTVDFIFGDAAVVIQKSDILVRKPLTPKIAVVTAQAKQIPRSASGISIQKCTIKAAENLGHVKTFLGRPWKKYSTVVIMESELGSLIDPKGWFLSRDYTASDTVFYVEHKNVGPGAKTDNRVRWKGLRVHHTQNDASKYTVKSFIGGDQWLPATGVPFEADL